MTWIESQHWDEVVYQVGGDLFHVNNSEGTTVKGTKVAHDVSINHMFNQALEFDVPVLTAALENSEKVKAIYIEGNHAKDLDLAYAYMLSKLFPQIEFDLEEKAFKRHVYKDVFIGYLHGDKPKKQNDVSKMFFQLYKQDIASAKTVEIHSQHLHHEKVKDDMGFTIRTLPTANEVDKWSYEQGHIGARKTFQAFIYNDSHLKALIYIDGE